MYDKEGMKAEALDRIYVIQTMIGNILYDGENKHSGLCEQSAVFVEEALELLCKAYVAQSDSVFGYEEKSSEGDV